MRLFINKISSHFPGRCCLCDERGHHGLDICLVCLKALPLNTQACSICAKPISYSPTNSATICGDCLNKKPTYSKVIAPYRYDYPSSHMVIALKFQGEQKYARLMGELIAKNIQNIPANQLPECLIPIPLHKNRFRERGFNQSELIAKFCARRLALKTDLNILKRTKSTRAQMLLSQKARLRNIKNAFSAKNPHGYRHVALIDDVLTTGATVNEAIKELKKVGVEKIEVWVYARTV